ncbi:MAG TPA: hypothetical protein VEZ12_13985 [Herpetosiphonaceae bacterium]|nr:hypothetical protein [Herpetosiphonaceae bacterium]
MMPGLAALTLIAYVVAVYLLWTDRSLRPLLLLLSGSTATLPQPLWGRLLGGTSNVPGNVIRFGETAMVPFWTVLGGGVLLAIPPLVVAYGLRHGWWRQHYVAVWAFFLTFVLFFLSVEALQSRSNIELFARVELPRAPRAESLLNAALLAGISLGLLYTFVATRHFGLQIAVMPLLAAGLAASLLLIGILCSPFWVARLLDQPERIVLVGAAVSAALVLWAIHLLASGLHINRHQHLQWR